MSEVSAISGHSDPSAAIRSDAIEKIERERQELMNEVLIEEMDRISATSIRSAIDVLKQTTERSMSDELASRTLDSMFGSFSMIQRIMQNMG